MVKENTFGRRHPPRRPKHSKTPKPHELNKSRSKRNSGSSLQDEGGKITPPSHFHTPWLMTVCVSLSHSSSRCRFCFSSDGSSGQKAHLQTGRLEADPFTQSIHSNQYKHFPLAGMLTCFSPLTPAGWRLLLSGVSLLDRVITPASPGKSLSFLSVTLYKRDSSVQCPIM